MPEDLGLFIERTRRMHPDVCRFISEIFYEDRLTGIEGLERQAIPGTGPLSGIGLRVFGVPHSGNTNASPEEASVVAEVIRELLGRRWRDRSGAEHALGPADILVVTPFNAQIREIEEALRAEGLAGVSVGTVDRFQGRQAPVVAYSTASSFALDAPRGMEFLYDPHHLNVAISRVQCLAVAVTSPERARVFGRGPSR